MAGEASNADFVRDNTGAIIGFKHNGQFFYPARIDAATGLLKAGAASVALTIMSLGQTPAPAAPQGIACSGTIAANGSVTLGTALDRVYTGGLYLYYPATAFSVLPAGFYYTIMSSTTVGQVFVNGPGSVLIVGSNSAYTGVTTAQACASVVIPAGLLGLRGVLRVKAAVVNFPSGNTKGVSFSFGSLATTIMNSSSIIAMLAWTEIINCNSAAAQLAFTNAYSPAGAGASIVQTATVDTSVAVTLATNLSLTTPTDWTILENAYAEFVPIP